MLTNSDNNLSLISVVFQILETDMQQEKGFLIALEGIDQAGKWTQAQLLAKGLRQLTYPVEVISFPDHSTPLGAELFSYLRGERDFSREVRQMLFAANRWELAPKIRKCLASGETVIIDRYIGSGVAYGIALALDETWVWNLEKGLPLPSLTVLLDISPEVSLHRKQTGRDAYEEQMELLSLVRQTYLKLARTYDWEVIPGEAPPNRIVEMIFEVVVAKMER